MRRDKRYESEIKKEGCKEGSNLQRIRLFQAFSKQTGAKFARNKRHDSSGGGLGRVAWTTAFITRPELVLSRLFAPAIFEPFYISLVLNTERLSGNQNANEG